MTTRATLIAFYGINIFQTLDPQISISKLLIYARFFWSNSNIGRTDLGIIHLVRTQSFPKSYNFYPLMCIRVCFWFLYMISIWGENWSELEKLVHRRCSLKKSVIKNWRAWRPATLLERDSNADISCEYCENFKKILKNGCFFKGSLSTKWLLLYSFINTSLWAKIKLNKVIKFSIEDFSSKHDQTSYLVIFTEEIFNAKLHLLCSGSCPLSFHLLSYIFTQENKLH